MTALSFNKLEDAYIMIYENAKELIVESRLLFNYERYARSYALAQIANEELAKLPIVYQEATRSFFKEKHDWKDFYKRLRSHESKNKLNYVYQQITSDEINAQTSTLEYDKVMENIKFINQVKNISLYADVKNNKFTKPSNEINKKLAKAHLEVAEEMLINFSASKFHVKGNIKKSLDNDKAKLQRELFKKAGFIK